MSGRVLVDPHHWLLAEEQAHETFSRLDWLRRAGISRDGGVDVHYIFLEGLHGAGGGVWEIQWGS